MFMKMEKEWSQGSGKPIKPDNDNYHISTCLAGGLAGQLSWAIVYPVDVLKTKIQVVNDPTLSASSGSMAAMKLGDNKTSIIKTSVKLYRQYGIRAFYNGLSTAVVRAFPVNGATFFFYEEIKKRWHWL